MCYSHDEIPQTILLNLRTFAARNR